MLLWATAHVHICERFGCAMDLVCSLDECMLAGRDEPEDLGISFKTWRV